MSLQTYKKKRSFEKTPEPKGLKKGSKSRQLLFVVQKHDARRLHYDFRLELRGVLKSWAVPKGPSMNPADKRLAMHVEDHPYDYKDFEGVIPKGNYGAGTVIVWDTGFYAPAKGGKTIEEQEKQLLREYHKGSMSIVMKGKKLKGEFALVKTSGREENAWLLIKKKDAFSSTADITKLDKSVISKKTIETIASSKNPKQWVSNKDEKGKLKDGRNNGELNVGRSVVADVIKLVRKNKDARKSSFPKDVIPMLATLTDTVVEGDDWTYEIKWDGYRALAFMNKGKAYLRSRNNKSFDDQFYPILQEIQKWKINALVDGEIVAVNEKGVSSFQKLQNWRSEADGELFFYVFDILWLEGYDLMGLTLEQRRNILQNLVPRDGLIRFSESFETNAQDFLKAAGDMGLEGVMAKKKDSEYVPGTRTRTWLKIKSSQRHEAIICGYTLNEASSKYFSSLILGVYKNNKLHYIGQVGTGYTGSMQQEILKKLKPLIIKNSPFSETPEVNKPSRFRPRSPKAVVTWVKPKLVCEVQYQELTDEGIMRQPSFKGLRTDKPAEQVVEEKPVHIPKKKTMDKTTIAKKVAVKKTGQRKIFLNPHEETQVRTINGQELKFTNLSKIYWPKEKITKRDMLNYYYQVTPYILPYMKDRPQSLNRYPNGINKPSFYQKNVADKIPSWLRTHDYENTSKEGRKKFLVCTNEASLLYMANLGCIEMNPWHSRVQSPDSPDWCVIDLDPDTNPFEEVIESANVVRKILEAIGIPSYPKTSGSTGIHIYIPLGAKYDYEQSKTLAELIVNLAHKEIPGFTSLERSPSKRKGKIYLDYLQNRSIQTIAAPYSLRPKPGATASAPLHWDEVRKGLKVKDFNINNMMDRIRSVGDLFKGVLGKGIDIEKTLKKISTTFH